MSTEKETLQFCEDKKVDFDLLNYMLKVATTQNEGKCYFNPSQDELRNLALFLKMLSKSSSFAHKAHKELQKLS